MITNALKALEPMGLELRTVSQAVAQVGDAIRRSGDNASAEAVKIMGLVVGDATIVAPHLSQFTDVHGLRHLALAVIEGAFKAGDKGFDPVELMDAAVTRAKKHRSKPELAFCWTPAPVAGSNTAGVLQEGETVKEVAGATVTVRADGQIKKGGRKVAALELYKKHVLEATEPMTSAQFRDLLVAELQMSPAGATTYGYNCRAELGVSPNAAPVVKGGKKTKGGQPTKQDRANDLYTTHVLAGDRLDKAAFIALAMKTLDTSKLGAQTYFYAAKAKLGEAAAVVVEEAPAPKAKKATKAAAKAAPSADVPAPKAAAKKAPKVKAAKAAAEIVDHVVAK